MRYIVAGLTLLLSSSTLLAQQPAAGNITCSQPPASAPSEASRAFRSGDFANASALYAAEIAGKPSAIAYSGLIASQLQDDKVTDALDTAKRAAAAFPNSSAVQAALGDAELRASHLDEAAEAYKAARKLDPCSARAHFGTARLLELSSMHASAQKELIVAHKLAVTDSEISEALFATLPPALEAKGLHNLLSSTPDMPADRKHRLEQRAALLESGLQCTVQDSLKEPMKVDLTPVQFSGRTLRDWGLRVTLAEGKTINLELDSTASGIVLSETEAARQGVKPAIAGQTVAPYLASADNVQIAGLRFSRCAVKVVPDLQLPHGQSLIGTDFFRDAVISFNWPGRFMTLSPYPTPAAGALADATIPAAEKDWTHVFVDGHRILVATAINKQPTGLFMYDTAYVPTVLSPAIGATLHPQTDKTASVDGYSGQVVRFFYKDGNPIDRPDVLDAKGNLLKLERPQTFTTFRFAGNEHPDKDTFVFDITGVSHAAGVEIAGIFGYPLMREYFTDIDYRNGLMQLKYDPNFYLRDSSPAH